MKQKSAPYFAALFFGLVMINADKLIGQYIHITDFGAGLCKGIGIGLLVFFIAAVARKRIKM